MFAPSVKIRPSVPPMTRKQKSDIRKSRRKAHSPICLLKTVSIGGFSLQKTLSHMRITHHTKTYGWLSIDNSGCCILQYPPKNKFTHCIHGLPLNKNGGFHVVQYAGPYRLVSAASVKHKTVNRPWFIRGYNRVVAGPFHHADIARAHLKQYVKLCNTVAEFYQHTPMIGVLGSTKLASIFADTAYAGLRDTTEWHLVTCYTNPKLLVYDMNKLQKGDSHWPDHLGQDVRTDFILLDGKREMIVPTEAL